MRALRVALESPICTRRKQNKKPWTATRYSALTSFLFTHCVREIYIWQIDKISYLCSTRRVNRCFAAHDAFIHFFLLSFRIVPFSPRENGVLLSVQPSGRYGLTLKSHMSLVTAALAGQLPGRVIFKPAVHRRRDQSSNLNFRFLDDEGTRKKIRSIYQHIFMFQGWRYETRYLCRQLDSYTRNSDNVSMPWCNVSPDRSFYTR